MREVGEKDNVSFEGEAEAGARDDGVQPVGELQFAPFSTSVDDVHSLSSSNPLHTPFVVAVEPSVQHPALRVHLRCFPYGRPFINSHYIAPLAEQG